MRNQTRRRWIRPAAGALAVVLGVPALAQAQQGGLFPNATIRRERVPCPLEDPVYKLYRNEYFGYHPTCWRRFPAGWGCPSPEAPNAAEAFRLLPRDKPPADGGLPGDEGNLAPGPGDEGMPGGPGAGTGAGAGAPGGGARPGGGRGGPGASPSPLPPLPSGERSPFELDTRPTNPPAAGGAAPRSPFETDPATPPAGGRGTTPPAGAKPGRRAPEAGNALPDLPPGGGAAAASPAPSTPAPDAAPSEPAAPATPSASAPAPAPGPNPGETQPLLALPDPTVNPSSGTAVAGTPLPPGVGPAPVVESPRRTRIISNLFSGRMFRR